MIVTGEHTSQLHHALFLREHLHFRQRGVVVLEHQDVLVGEGCHLRQVGHHQHLHVPGEHCQAATNLDGGLAAHARVDFVKDECGHGVHFGEHHFESEHHAGELAAGCTLAERAGHGGAVGCQHEGDGVAAVYREFLRLGNFHHKGGVRHGQGGQLLAHRIGKFLGGRAAQVCQLFCLFPQDLAQLHEFRFESFLALRVVNEGVQAGAGFLGPFKHLGDIRPVLAHERCQLGAAGLHLRQTLGSLHIQGSRIGGKIRGDIGGQDHELVDTSFQGGKLFIGRGLSLQGATGGIEQTHNVGFLAARVFATAQCGQGGRGGNPQSLNVHELHHFGLELVLFTRAGVDGGNLLERPLQALRL